MNCKPGDLAIVTGGGVPQNVGRIVRVLNLDFPGTVRNGIELWGDEPVWEVEGRLVTCDADGSCLRSVSNLHYADRFLHPISGVPIVNEVTEDLKEPA